MYGSAVLAATGWLARPAKAQPVNAFPLDKDWVGRIDCEALFSKRVFMDETVVLPPKFNVNNSVFIRCNIVVEDDYHMIACPIKYVNRPSSDIHVGGTTEWRPSCFHNTAFTDCTIEKV